MNRRTLAYRYARAFLRVHGEPNDPQAWVVQVALFSRFLRLYRHRCDLAHRRTCAALCDVFFDSTKTFRRLIELIHGHGRLALFPDIVHALHDVCSARYGIVVTTMRASHVLSHDDRQAVSDFFADVTGQRVVFRFVHDRSLIAGIRVEAGTYVWEQSVSQRLRAIEQVYQ